MGQLEPGAGEGVGELLRVFQEAARDLFVSRIEAQRQVRGQHGRTQGCAAVGVRDHRIGALGHPLMGTGRALGQFPLIVEQVLEEVIAPLGRSLGPGHFQAGTDGVATDAAAEAALPAHALVFQALAFRFTAHVLGVACTVGLAEGVATGDQGHGFFIVHRHAGEGFADVMGGCDRVGVAFRTFRVHVDQAHLDGGQRVFQVAAGGAGAALLIAVTVGIGRDLAVAGAGLALAVAVIAAQPGRFGTPVDVQVRFPHVLAATGETEGLETHGFQRDVAGQDQQVSPGDLVAVLLLDRPDQAACLVQVDVVGPAVQGREALLATACTATAVANAIGAGAVPGHADEQRTIVAEVGRPPILRIGHHLGQVGLDGSQVEALEGFCVIEILTHGVGLGRMLGQQVQTELLGPPVAVAGAAAGGMVEGALGFIRHCVLSC